MYKKGKFLCKMRAPGHSGHSGMPTASSAMQALRSYCSHGPRRPNYFFSWQQILVFSMWHWFFGKEECKSYGVTEVSPWISEVGLGGHAAWYDGVIILARGTWKSNVWSWESEDKAVMETPRSLRCWEYVTFTKESCRQWAEPATKEVMWTETSKAIRGGCSGFLELTSYQYMPWVLAVELQDLMFPAGFWFHLVQIPFYSPFFSFGMEMFTCSILCWLYLLSFLFLEGLTHNNPWVLLETLSFDFSAILEPLRIWQLLEMN